eukprot:tig00020610_g12083.t1
MAALFKAFVKARAAGHVAHAPELVPLIIPVALASGIGTYVALRKVTGSEANDISFTKDMQFANNQYAHIAPMKELRGYSGRWFGIMSSIPEEFQEENMAKLRAEAAAKRAAKANL